MNRRLRDLVQSLGRRLGFELVPLWRLPALELATHLRQLFAALRIDVVLDVGANQGQYRDFLRSHVGYGGRIVSFEPVKANAAKLRDRVTSDKNWTVCDFALGDAGCTMAMNVMKQTSFSSLLNPAKSASPVLDELNAVNYQEDVAVRRLDEALDEVLPEGAGGNIYLKLDTQGYDLRVIEGTAGVLGRIAALQTELSIQQIYDGAPDYLTALTTLNRLGFDPTGFFPVIRDASLRVMELDCVMISRRHATVAGRA